ncbi:MAG: hypothetical protein JNK72_04305 [Myxococcales bacterium]|nr:hypothetical protein [Myxococcales bacterium]
MKAWLGALALSAAVTGCPSNDGQDPPNDQFYRPIAAAIGGDGNWLFVANSNFDLRYNGGTVVAVDLARVRARAVEAAAGQPGNNCRPDATRSGAVVCPSGDFIRAEVTRKINPFAVDLAYAQYPNHQRLYVVVRGDGSLTWFDVDNAGSLNCGASAAGGACDDAHRVGVDPAQSPAGVRLPPDPSALAVDPARGWVVVTHQNVDPNLARASLFRDTAALAGATASARPVMLNTVGNLALGLSGVALLPRGDASDPTRSTFVSTSRAAATLTFLQAYPGNAALADGQPFLYQSAAVPLVGLSTGANNRSVAFDPTPGANRAFVVSRAPEALLVVRLDPANPTQVVINDAIPIPAGPSRLTVERDTSSGRTLVYVASYDARRLSVVDPDAHRVIAQEFTNRGPHTVLRDPRAPFLYVLDFLDDSLEVIDLRPTVDGGAANVNYLHRVLTLGASAR